MSGLFIFIEEVKMLSCSRCHFEGISRAETFEEATTIFNSQGWQRRGNRVLCPKCVEEL